MPYRIAKSFTVESGHLLTKHGGGCRFPHGHSRTIEIVVTSEQLNDADMVCDFKAVKAAAMAAVQRFDHAFALNTADPRFQELKQAYGDHVIPFTDTDPTSEVIAREIFQQVSRELAVPGARLERVRVTETGTSWAEYWE